MAIISTNRTYSVKVNKVDSSLSTSNFKYQWVVDKSAGVTLTNSNTPNLSARFSSTGEWGFNVKFTDGIFPMVCSTKKIEKVTPENEGEQVVDLSKTKSVTIPVYFKIPANTAIYEKSDTIFDIDQSGSMSKVISSVRDEVQNIISTLLGTAGDAQCSLVSCATNTRYTGGTSYGHTERMCYLTSRVDTLKEYLSKMNSSGDADERPVYAIQQYAKQYSSSNTDTTGETGEKWRDGSLRFYVQFTDEDGYKENVTRSEARKVLVANKVKYMYICSGDSYADLRDLANDSDVGAGYYRFSNTGDSSSKIVEHIQTALKNKSSNLTIKLNRVNGSGDQSKVTATWSPTSIRNVNPDNTEYKFDITFTKPDTGTGKYEVTFRLDILTSDDVKIDDIPVKVTVEF